MLTIKKLSRAAIGLLILSILAFSIQAQTKQTVRFPKNSNAATVTGKIVSAEGVIYLVSARKGQTLEINIADSRANNDVVAEVFAPGGRNLTGENYGKQWRGKLTRTGVYEIRVGTIESENAEFKMRITLR